MLAQWACGTPQCVSGEASINQMDSVYQMLPPDIQAKFQSAHAAIMSSFSSYWIGIDKWIPFNPVCCSIQQIGIQADQLTVQMQQAMGQIPISPPPATQAGTSMLLWIGLAIAALFLLQSGRVTIVR